MPADRTDTFRILDAAANRAREGLRVAEDYARFVLDDAHLAMRLKESRHELASCLRGVEGDGLLAARDATRDVGTELTTEAERVRRSPLDVARAAMRRAEEGLRTLEEFGKLVSPEFAERCGRLRYAAYTLEKALVATAEAGAVLAGCDLCLLLSESACAGGAEFVAREALWAGVGMIQVREKSRSDRDLLAVALRARGWTRDAGALLIVNDRPDIAVLAEADGVHVGQDDLPVREARRIVGPRKLVGVSTHDPAQARQAVLDGADYLGVGPTFRSRTKEFLELSGLEFVRAVAAEISLPWFAIGGIDAENAREVAAAGATRVAIGGAICAAGDPGEAARSIRARLRRE